MLEFKSLNIENFFSIGSVYLPIEKGVYLVRGVNRDIIANDEVSNGAGKTATFNAIYQCLFNKNLKYRNASIHDLNNHYTKQPYRIILKFKKDNIDYTIINDRTVPIIKILRNGKSIEPKGIPNQLKAIKELLGLDFDSFSSLTYLNQASLSSIIDLSNKENILYQIFQLEKLVFVEKEAKEKIKNLKREIDILETKKDSVEGSIRTLSEHKYVDLTKFEKELSSLQRELSNIENDFSKKIEEAQNLYNNAHEKVQSLLDSLKANKLKLEAMKKDLDLLEEGICPLCGSKCKTTYDKKKKTFEKEFHLHNTKVSEYKRWKNFESQYLNDVKTLNSDFNTLSSTYKEKIYNLKNTIRTIKATNAIVEKIQTQKEKYQKDLKDIDEELQVASYKLEYLKEALNVMRSGSLINAYLGKYVSIFKHNILYFKKMTSFTFDIQISVAKGKMSYRFVDNGVEKDFGALSSGEQTRVSLLLLLATLRSIEQLLDLKINFLVFVELFGVLEPEGIKFIVGVLKVLKKEKAIFVVNHHDEIDTFIADKVILIEKKNNISSLEVKNVD